MSISVIAVLKVLRRTTRSTIGREVLHRPQMAFAVILVVVDVVIVFVSVLLTSPTITFPASILPVVIYNLEKRLTCANLLPTAGTL
jgi:heme O synthase-like polyprenyltransferase